jgi:N-methylhydantoinase B/oxoprolinase/acetone carboxylase alpha subunit
MEPRTAPVGDSFVAFNAEWKIRLQKFVGDIGERGPLLKPRFPAALSCRTHALGRIFDVLGGLLGQRQPEFLCAAGFSSSPHLMYSGFDSRGEWYQLYQISFGGIPGRPSGDGPDGHSIMCTSTRS